MWCPYRYLPILTNLRRWRSRATGLSFRGIGSWQVCIATSFTFCELITVRLYFCAKVVRILGLRHNIKNIKIAELEAASRIENGSYIPPGIYPLFCHVPNARRSRYHTSPRCIRFESLSFVIHNELHACAQIDTG